jgi:hypothetical protein
MPALASSGTSSSSVAMADTMTVVTIVFMAIPSFLDEINQNYSLIVEALHLQLAVIALRTQNSRDCNKD